LPREAREEGGARMRLVLPIEPVPKGRPRFSKRGHAYTPQKTRVFERDVATLLRVAYRHPPLAGAIYCEVLFYLTKPKRCRRQFPSVRPDVDNLIKGVKDAANGILWTDDGQVVDLRGRKLYGEPARIELEVYEISEAV
jgi:Holliday junction resolvase RusA-like endonuclease